MTWFSIGPLAALLILFATVIPVELRHPSLALVSWSFDPLDFLLNIVLFLPLGVALSGRRRFGLAALLVGTSLSIEVLQLGQMGRHAGPWDVLANLIGGLLGALPLRICRRRIQVDSGYLGIDRAPLLALFVIGGILPLLAIAGPGELHDFSNWNGSYRLAIADEITRDRTWKGTLAAWEIYDRALSRDAIRRIADRTDSPQAAPPQVNASSLSPLESWRNAVPTIPTQFSEFPTRLSDRIYQRLVQTNEISVLVWIQPSDIDQVEDERVITLSKDPYNRNFSITQRAGVMGFRLRTPTSGSNGTAPKVESEAILQPGTKYFVAATYDGYVSRLYVDGELSGRRNLSSDGSLVFLGEELLLPAVLAFCGGCLSGLFIVLSRSTTPISRAFLGTLAGAAVATFAWAVLDGSLDPIFYLIRRVMPPLIGAWGVAMSVSSRTNSTSPAS